MHSATAPGVNALRVLNFLGRPLLCLLQTELVHLLVGAVVLFQFRHPVYVLWLLDDQVRAKYFGTILQDLPTLDLEIYNTLLCPPLQDDSEISELVLNSLWL